MTADSALKKLEEYGERFMTLFDDDERGKARQGSGIAKRKADATRKERGTAKDGDHGGRRAIEGSTAANGAKVNKQTGATPGGSEKQLPTGGGRQENRSGCKPSTAPSVTNGKQPKRITETGDEIDRIMRAGKKAKLNGSDQAANGNNVPPGRPMSTPSSFLSAEALRRERKLFMSHKASKVHETVQEVPSITLQPQEDAGLSPEEFQKLQMEVEKFASTSLDKKNAKLYKARMLARLGAKADTAPRTAASIGKGMAKMAVKRQARALEEAIETGMVQRKGLGKKKRALKDKNRDRGLMEAGPAFKNGILRIKPIKKARAESGKLRLPKGML